ncbi:glycosyltransferase [Zeaxanthinibacter enoshimensis]|uniref:Glycosyltransferase involved in cell wall biosynthesis n=1 Tax=Zeaxanthinibacter enoshimensis TaxID=392009 RepID=A0A4R6TJU7_9FLAO|nr:glycosyltransferase [Zeaxanthinibacter enoshimensis]TDQ31164.1 glycosyltransferase involved in cell wall biosynthesis [Zeaxanthinibacter enoshimensis]
MKKYQKKKILVILPNDFLGGAEQYLKMVASNFQNEEVYIFVFSKKKTGSWDDIANYTQIEYSDSDNILMSIFNFLQFLWSKKNTIFDFIFSSHVYYTGITGIFIRLRFLNKDRFIARESTSIFRRFSGFKLWTYRAMYKIGYKPVDLLVCQTELMKQQLEEGLPGLSRSLKIKVIPNPIDLNKLKEKIKTLHNAEIPDNYIVSAGRLIPEKGFDLLIRAFANSQGETGRKLLILGEGKERNILESMIEELDLQGKVFLIGHVDNVYPYFQNAEACIVSSRIEGFPNVLLQMMSVNNRVGSTLCAGGIENIPGIHTCLPDKIDELSGLLNLTLADSNDNRIAFDKYLNERSVENHIEKIKAYTD